MSTPTSVAGLASVLNSLTLDLGDGWTRDPEPTRDAAHAYHHLDGHRIGLCPLYGGTILQTWITAGPHLPPLPDTSHEVEKAKAQTARDARLQPGRSWHATIRTRQTDNLPRTITDVIQGQLISALTHKPKHALVISHGLKPKPAPTKRRTTRTSKMKGTRT